MKLRGKWPPAAPSQFQTIFRIDFLTMQCNAMQCNAMQCNAMQCNIILNESQHPRPVHYGYGSFGVQHPASSNAGLVWVLYSWLLGNGWLLPNGHLVPRFSLRVIVGHSLPDRLSFSGNPKPWLLGNGWLLPNGHLVSRFSLRVIVGHSLPDRLSFSGNPKPSQSQTIFLMDSVVHCNANAL